ncbi:SRPBCC domain-containing protein [Streptomyces sp. NBC_01387]|uniref:SRPBCC domain-containing protein n=1 Tax=unclassified Streptomyces TaxID=2593676 RepID=UPI0020253660|nr:MULTISPECIES: SRPBCC domain-containing protein [unclassified Streptomyces]MCX4549053.1 SRPBCC domain-containing protein [Streptomyces sp. NBC_01500]WSC20631.1 SRPBCC domain-containing protein [Streptomyces sp. NBC_01766]WSV54660.1 SRPBCC domain-containing protein [Streptomyces sp. NBC_01014]
MTEALAHGTSTSHGNSHVLRFALYLPHPAARVWGAVATPVGLPGWLAAADVFESRLDGRVTLRWLNEPTVATGSITAWDPERVVEYTLSVHGRVRFHLESVGPDATVVRFSNEFTGAPAQLLDSLAGWHIHFEFLYDALEGSPKDWSSWNRERWQLLRAAYERGGTHS